MAADRKGENGNYSDDDFSEYLERLERQDDSMVRQPRSGTRRSAPHAEQHPAAGRHSAPAHKNTRAHSAPPPHKPVKRLTPRQRRFRRRIKLLIALLVVAGIVFVVTNITVARVKGFEVASSTTDQQVLTWNSVRGADGYVIRDSSGNLLKEIGPDGETQYAISGLQGGMRYTYSISAVKNFLGKHTGRAVECTAYTTPTAVSTAMAINSGNGALLNWENGAASGYEVQYTDPSGMPVTLETQNADGQGLSIPDLQAGTQYAFQVRSYVQDGENRIYSDWFSTEPLIAAHTADMTGVDVTKPMVALTFDDGPDYGDVTERILATLKKYGGHASFFQCGASAADLPSLMSHIASEGHEIACHTYDHTHYGTDVTADDIIKADDAIEQAVGQRPTAFRSPGGSTTDLIRNICVSEGMPIFYWSIDTEDWKSRDADAVCDAVIGKVSDGDIVLMHNVYTSTADAVDRIVPYLVDEGYQLVTVSQLVQAKTGKPAVPGTQYVTATITN